MYCYKFILDSEVKYVGITGNIKNRIKQHEYASSWYDCQMIVKYCELPNSFTTKAYEQYLINTLRPIYNNTKKNLDVSLIKFDDEKISWKIFQKSSFNQPVKKRTRKSNSTYTSSLFNLVRKCAHVKMNNIGQIEKIECYLDDIKLTELDIKELAASNVETEQGRENIFKRVNYSTENKKLILYPFDDLNVELLKNTFSLL